jgi:predicted alpha/beta superfamily hydrolase
MRRLLLSLALLLPCLLPCAQAPAVTHVRPFVIGETVTLHSAALGEDRLLNVYLPEGYHPDSAARYPVIYLLDGSADEDFVHIAGLVQFGAFPWVGMLQPSIVVGIANVDRRRDFTFPTRNARDLADFPTTGGSKAFLQFLEQELQPAVAARYRVEGRGTLVGQSLGGLLAAEVLHRKPGLFQHYIVVSPSLWWDDRSLLAADMQRLPAGSRVFVAVGKEGDEMEGPARAFAEKLRSVAADPADVQFQHYPAANHGNILHLAAYDALAWLFGTGR